MFLAIEGPAATINISQQNYRKVTSALWGTLDQYIITGHEDGALIQWDARVNRIYPVEPCPSVEVSSR